MNNTDIGEYIVGAYLKLIKKCDIIDYNARPPGGGLKGLEELDVVGLDFKNKTAYLCEVTTHIRGVLYKNNVETIKRIKAKYARQKDYAKKHLKQFPNRHFMFWSPVVPEGYITNNLRKLSGLDLIINKDYSACIEVLRHEAAHTTNDTGNPFFRVLQILEHLR